MDYILKLWTRNAPELPLELPRMTGYEFITGDICPAAPDDIPAEVLLSVSGIEYMTELILRGESVGDAARAGAYRYAQKLADELEGVLEDTMPALGAQRFDIQADRIVFPQITQYTGMMYLSVWYPPDRGFDACSRELVEIFEKYFPYALPERYGTAEPPEQEYAQGGREGLAEFINGNKSIVWYARLPVTHVFLNDSFRNRPEGGRTVNCITVVMPDKLYDIPEWGYAARRLLQRLALLGTQNGAPGAFFGQITRQKRQVSSWWWKGIPAELGCACIIGGAYRKLIPDCEKGEDIGNNTVYFEEPEGPFIQSELLSTEKKRFFARRNAPLCAADFTEAKRIPEEIYRTEGTGADVTE